ncbi:kinase-like protein [Hymenopellis radicata]|nr:kinase-like protein [Hymenopellis radicata]
MASSSFLDQYDPLDIIGNGSFGIIRKVRRKSDGIIFARKELDFERMNERDRKQIVAEVNILKDLHHDHIVRYHDRHVDRDAGILYILMEYCGGGDLSNVIKQALKHNRPIPEDTVWNYFMQILLALQHCHHPNGSGHGRTNSTGSDTNDPHRRAQILHRDLKPDNVFLDENNTVKLGDFGLSKALPKRALPIPTLEYTPYYMSPELMQEKAYDAKSDIWSLGCLIYELCALRPPFHEAKTHTELSILIRNGRIPPLPKGYSQSLTAVIKSMLNLNPAMRPSTVQLLQHERLELVFKAASRQGPQTSSSSKRTRAKREGTRFPSKRSCLLAREAGLGDAVRMAILAREEELRVLIQAREEEVAAANAKREEEIIFSVNAREKEFCDAWRQREEAMEEKIRWCEKREQELLEEEDRVNSVRQEVEERMAQWERDRANAKPAKEPRLHKSPLEEVKNVLEPLQRLPQHLSTPGPPSIKAFPTPGSAMRGVVLTATGEPIMTPAPAAAALFANSPKVALNFAKIFDFDDDDGGDVGLSPSQRRSTRESTPTPTTSGATPSSSASSAKPPPTRLRRPSITLSDALKAQPLSHPHLRSSPAPASYDLADEENLPSPFLKRTERLAVNEKSTGKPKKRPSSGNLLRAVAAANAAVRTRPLSSASSDGARPSIASARKAGDEARKALFRT